MTCFKSITIYVIHCTTHANISKFDIFSLQRHTSRTLSARLLGDHGNNLVCHKVSNEIGHWVRAPQLYKLVQASLNGHWVCIFNFKEYEQLKTDNCQLVSFVDISRGYCWFLKELFLGHYNMQICHTQIRSGCYLPKHPERKTDLRPALLVCPSSSSVRLLLFMDTVKVCLLQSVLCPDLITFR